jgi:LCP family protein required for cell wall assembly
VRRLFEILAMSLAVVLIAGGSIGAVAAQTLKSQIKTVSIGAKEDKIAAQTSIGAIKGGANILLAGSDTRVGQTDVQAGVADGSRNDVTILIHLSADHKQMTAVSFPRDLMVDTPSCTGNGGATFPAANYQQFNTTLGNGLGCTVASVESLTGLTIPYAAEITFDGVIEMSNAIGGVDVCIAKPINDSDSGLVLSAGNHTIQGLQALEFLRTRHGVGDGSDLARISSQQVFLSSMMRKIVSGGSLSNPVTLYGLASAAVKNMTLSKSLSDPNTMVELGLALKNINLSNVLFVQYPTTTDPQNVNRVVPDQADAALLTKDLQTDTKFTLGADSTGRASVTQGESSGAGTPASGTGTSTASGSGSTSSGSTGTATGTATPGATPTPTATALPSTITGQSASEQTCSVGNG